MKRPSFQFYPGDWLRDTALRSCSTGARGLWIDMLSYMHEGSPYGYLKVGDKVILPPNLARMVGATLPEVEGWLSELFAAGVPSKDDSGCIFSRRMVKDESLRTVRATGGKLGGNPALKVNHKVNLGDNHKVNQKPTPSSSSSSSSSSSLKDPLIVPHYPEVAIDPVLPKSPLVGQDGVLFFREIVSVMFDRKKTDVWSYDEERGMALVLKRPNWKEELREISIHFKHVLPERKKFDFPATMRKLLDDWNGALDKARSAAKDRKRLAEATPRDEGVRT